MKTPTNLVSRKQAIKLKQAGFNRTVSYRMVNFLEERPETGVRFNCLQLSYPDDWNNTDEIFTSVPTVYEAIDWIATQLKKDENIIPFDYIGYIYINPEVTGRYSELRKLIDAKLNLLISSRKKSAKNKKHRLSKS